MSAFLVGVLSSLIASFLLIIGGWFGSHRVRKVLTKVLSVLVKVDIERNFATQRDAAKELASAIDRAREVHFFWRSRKRVDKVHLRPALEYAGR